MKRVVLKSAVIKSELDIYRNNFLGPSADSARIEMEGIKITEHLLDDFREY